MPILSLRPGSMFLSLLGAAAIALVTSSALGVAGQHTTLASFQQNVRADVLLEPFTGATQNFFAPYPVSGNGYVCAVDSPNGVRRDTAGIGGLSDGSSTRFTFTGRATTAFAGTLRVLDQNLVSIGGTVNVTLSTGETFTATVPVGGAFFGVTSTEPFTSVLLDSPLHSPPSSNATYEYIDDVYVGTSGTAVLPADNCADAVCISPITAVQYPFTTVGATATPIAGSCAATPSLDNGPDVWFRFVAIVTGNVTLTTCGASFDTILRVFDSCGSANHLVCNDDFCTGGAGAFASRVIFRCQSGEDYLIRISGYSGASGTGNLTFSVVPDCTGDFNHNGGKEVQDIFDFLSAWFGGC